MFTSHRRNSCPCPAVPTLRDINVYYVNIDFPERRGCGTRASIVHCFVLPKSPDCDDVAIVLCGRYWLFILPPKSSGEQLTLQLSIMIPYAQQNAKNLAKAAAAAASAGPGGAGLASSSAVKPKQKMDIEKKTLSRVETGQVGLFESQPRALQWYVDEKQRSRGARRCQ